MRRYLLVAMLLIVSVGTATCDAPTGLLAPGTEWEHPFYTIDSGVAGPTVLLVGGMHGDEPAGYRAADQIRHWPIHSGRLIVVPRVNTPGLAAGTRYMPGIEDRALRNANRNFPKLGERNVAQTPPCKDLWRLAKAIRPDWVVDLHEGFDFHATNSKSVGSSLIYRTDAGIDEIVDLIHSTINAAIEKPSRKFDKLTGGPVNGGILRAAAERLDAKVLGLETTSRDQPMSLRTRQHRLMVSTLLQEIGVTSEDLVDVAAPRERDETYVALYDAAGTGGKGVPRLTEILDSAESYVAQHVGPADIRAGMLSQFDAIIFPGGSGGGQARGIGEDGADLVKSFVEGGGDYLGICAGGYLASSRYSWSLGLLNANCYTGPVQVPGEGTKQLWYRGKATMVEMEFTDDGEDSLGAGLPRKVKIRYMNGPILSPAGADDLPDYEVLARFRSENWTYERQKGTMIDTPAIVAATCGSGRVIVISPHPESTDGLESVVTRAMDWLSAD